MLGRGRSRPARGEGETTIFFATDLHGSEVCFRKFVAAAGFYGADLLVLGGDLTGKLVVPLVEDGGGDYVAELHGERTRLRAAQTADFERQIADEGLYPHRMSLAEHDRLEADPDAVQQLFIELMLGRLANWIDYAKERLEGTDVRIITTPGNDDPPEIDEVIRARGGGRVLLLEGDIYEVAPGHQMINSGYSNPTPWHTPREYPEQFVGEHVEAMAERVENPAGAIFNIHVPPYDSGLDTAPLLDEHLTVRTSMGAQMSAPVGSTAVRETIERHQPLLSLHGHIHESGGTVRIGRTVAINPGSEYSEGVLRGALVTVGGGRLVRYQATSG
jgi:Icc-related predicted phosphoesterase